MNTHDLYDKLGVPKDAALETIKKAFRRKASKAHPDKGGTVEKFHAIRLAYEVLSDSSKRAKYDETGGYDNAPDNETARVNELFVQIFEQVVQLHSGNIKSANIFKLMEHDIHKKQAELSAAVTGIRKEQDVKRYIISKLAFKGTSGETNILHNALEANIAHLQVSIDNAQKQQEVYGKLLAMIPIYEFAYEPVVSDNSDGIISRYTDEVFGEYLRGGFR
jgi:curved DNA-binding protein CbpA